NKESNQVYAPRPKAVVKKSKNRGLFAKSPAGRVSGMLFTIFGAVGTSVSLIAMGLVAVVTSFMFDAATVMGITFGTLMPVLAVSAAALLGGTRLRNRVKRFKRYVGQLGKRDFCSVNELADSVGKKSNFAVKDLNKMIHLRMFTEGRLSEDRKFFLLSNEAYEEYIKMEEGVRLQEEAENQKRLAIERKKALEELNPELREINSVIDEGKETIKQIREANDAIDGEAISQKLDRLELVLKKIFIYLELHPEEVSETRKFIGYYLPTTLKLVNAYKDMDAEPIQGENIKTAKSEIEETMDTINLAFEKLLDSFFEDTAMDISTDITVLQTMLAQEGLTEEDFKCGGNKE
ncbi:MAG: 5-bromo-4-chloroindolyl phosphate hydrolysis family protein, partial [Eubacterium sp.]